MKKLLYILSHRSVFVALSLVAQIGALFFLLSFFSESDAAFYWSCIALSIVSSLLILGSRMEPAYKIAWLLLVLPFLLGLASMSTAVTASSLPSVPGYQRREPPPPCRRSFRC